MSLLKRVASVSKKLEADRLSSLEERVKQLSNQVDEFRHHVLENSISSPERARNFKKCTRLNSQIDSLLDQANELNKANEPEPEDFESRKKCEKQKLMDLKTQIQKISSQLEPDEVEEDYFRKVKRNEGEGSTSDLDKADDKADIGQHYDEEDGDEEDEEEEEPDDFDDENESEEDEDESEEDTWTGEPNNTVMVKQVEALSDFPGEQPDDLPFQKGEILTIIDPKEDGWWVAENSSGKRGIIPKTLIRIIEVPVVVESSQEPSKEAVKQEVDEASDLPSPKRSGKELWKSLQKGSTQETSVTDVLKALGAMPTGFRTPTLGKMSKDERYHISSWVVPKLRPSHLEFKDLVWDPVHKQLSPRPVKIDRVFSLMVARKIPLPGTGIEVLSRQMRMSLWDWKRKQVLSNVHSVRALQNDKDLLSWNFSAKSESSMYDGECLARLNSTEDTVGVLFELSVSYLRSSTGEKSEVSCGWCVLKLFEETGVPVANKTYELAVNGGTPFEENRIELDASIGPMGASGRFQSIIRTNQQPRLLVKLISYNKAAKDIHDTLPETVLTCHQYAQFIGQYRQLVAEVLFHDNREQFSTEAITDPVISTFPIVLRFTDIMDALKRRWDNRNKRELKRSQRRVTSVMKNFFREVYMDSVYPLLNSAQLPPFVWGDANREMERLRIILDYEAYSTIENLFSTERLHKPFNIDRITFNVVSKHSIS